MTLLKLDNHVARVINDDWCQFNIDSYLIS